eukprot:2927021-Rhodomonas_salina.1
MEVHRRTSSGLAEGPGGKTPTQGREAHVAGHWQGVTHQPLNPVRSQAFSLQVDTQSPSNARHSPRPALCEVQTLSHNSDWLCRSAVVYGVGERSSDVHGTAQYECSMVGL